MRENREIVLSEQEIQDICNDFGKKLSKELENEEKTPLFLGVMKGALNFMFDLIKRIDRPISPISSKSHPMLVYKLQAESILKKILIWTSKTAQSWWWKMLWIQVSL